MGVAKALLVSFVTVFIIAVMYTIQTKATAPFVPLITAVATADQLQTWSAIEYATNYWPMITILCLFIYVLIQSFVEEPTSRYI